MKVYLYDEETKEYKGEEEALLDPLETELQGKNIYLLPANASFDKPEVKKKDGYVVGFDVEKKKWTLIPDYRGKSYYTKNGINEVSQVGYLKEGQTLITDEERKLIDEGKLIFDPEQGKLIEYVETTEEKIMKLENEIERLNNKIVRDLRVLSDETATEEAQEEAQSYLAEKNEQITKLKEQIAELKKEQEDK